MTTDGVYQVMPPLSPDEYAKLRNEIADYGVLVPVVKDQHGNILDGHHRKQIADELGVSYRVDTVVVSDEQHARTLARTYNLGRRHLNREQKRQMIADEIRDNPDQSDRSIARIFGVDHKTVGSVRREVASGEIPHPADEWTEFTLLHWRTLQPNPAAELLPDMTPREFDGLTQSIDRNGLILPVVLDTTGRVLDGRQRLRACAKTGVEPRFRMYQGDDHVELVISLNIIRGHFTADQRALIAAEWETRSAAT